MPILQVILYFIGALLLLSSALIWLPSPADPSQRAKLIMTASTIFASLVLFGIGQAIGFLGEAAYYARRTYEHHLKQSAQKPPTHAIHE
jgi:hypothetical protein